LLLAGLCICSSVTLLRADVFAETIQNLQQLSFTSSVGSIVFSGFNEGTVVGTVSDSFNGQTQQTLSGTGPINVSPATPPIFFNGAEAGGAGTTVSVDASKLTSDNEATAELFSIAGSATAKATSTLTGSFEIVGATGPATLNVSALIQVVENFAQTDAFGQSGSAEALVSLALSNGGTPLSFDNLESVSGPNQAQSFTFNQTLTGSSILQAGTPYTFTVTEESSASVVNAATVTPEPSYLFLSIVLLSGLIAVRRSRFRASRTLGANRS
jgi:hypothetical protein